jgi:hypothetical protein
MHTQSCTGRLAGDAVVGLRCEHGPLRLCHAPTPARASAPTGQTPVYVPKGGTISVELWRNINDHKAWYEVGPSLPPPPVSFFHTPVHCVWALKLLPPGWHS